MASTEVRVVDQDEILDLVWCAEDYGHSGSVCMSSLYEFARPVTDSDIKRYSLSLKDEDGYGEEDRENAVEGLTAWREQYGH